VKRFVFALLAAGVAFGFRPLPAAPGITLVRQPYLQRLSATSATIVWATREAGAAEARYRAGAGAWTAVAALTRLYATAETSMPFDYYQHEATLTGLTPATTYTYDVLLGGSSATGGEDLLTTAPPSGTGSVSFIAFGDSGTGAAPQRRLAQLMIADSAANRWDLALHTGDVVYPKGTHALLHERFFDIYAPWLRRRPVFLSFGNHEEYAQKGKPYFDVFVLPENGASPAFPTHRERYYSFDYGPVHFIALDTQLTAGWQQQLDWLVRDLEATAQPWKVAFFHRPAFGSNEFVSAPDVQHPLRPIFERFGVQLVLEGHEHDYARGVPWREGSPSHQAVVYIVTGGGGAGLGNPSPGPWLASWASAFHYLRGTVTDCTTTGSCELSLEAIGEDGLPLDAFTLSLRSQRRDAVPPVVDWQAPLDGATVAGVVPIRAAASDDEQVAKVDFLIDGILRMADTTAPYEWAWDTRDDFNGTRRLELRAMDMNGHQRTSGLRTVDVRNPPTRVQVFAPARSDIAFTGVPYTIMWGVSQGTATLVRVDLEISADGGKTFAPIPDCRDLPGDARECVWTAPSPVTKKGVIRLSAIDSSKTVLTSTSDQFAVRSGTTELELKSPNKPARWGIGSRQSIAWSSGIGLAAAVSIELSRDGGASWSTLAPRVAYMPDFLWTVTGPPTANGLVRVTWLNGPVADTSDSMFVIEEPFLELSVPGSAAEWVCGSQVKVKWKTNLGLRDRLIVRLSTDNGATYPHVLAASVIANAGQAPVTVPQVDSADAIVRVESLDNPSWQDAGSRFRVRCGG
jgi:hypothetical protein